MTTKGHIFALFVKDVLLLKDFGDSSCFYFKRKIGVTLTWFGTLTVSIFHRFAYRLPQNLLFSISF